MQTLDIAVIRTDGGTQPRAQIDMATVAEYAEDMAREAAFPPVVVFFDGEYYWLADGFHRYHAALSLGLATLDADVRQGTLQEAQWYSYSVNQSHGLRRTPGDIRHAVEAALMHPFHMRYSQNQIASHVGVTPARVSQISASIKDLIDRPGEVLVTRGSTTYVQNTANIGRREEAKTQPQIEWQVAPEPLDDDEEEEPLTCFRCWHYIGSEYDNPGVCAVHRITIYGGDSFRANDGQAQDCADYTEDEPAQAEPAVYQPMAATVYSHRSVEYYTPVEILDAARAVLGQFDLDPASCEEAQRNVMATVFYSIEDNGLSRPWRGRVWLNPPYGKTNGRSNQEIWAQRLVSEYLEGHVTEAVLLVKAALGYKWFEELFRDWPVCFARSRLSFILEDGNDEGQSKQGTALFYFGENVDLFARTFRQIGRIIPPEAEIDAALFGQ